MRVYLSHSTTEADVVAAKALSRQLDAMGHEVSQSLDFREDPLAINREMAIQNCDLFVAILTSAYQQTDNNNPELLLARQFDVTRYFLIAESIFNVPQEIRTGLGQVGSFSRDTQGYNDAVVNVLEYYEDTAKPLSDKAKVASAQANTIFITYAQVDRLIAAQLDRLLRKNGLVAYWRNRIKDPVESRRITQTALKAAHVVVAIWSAQGAGALELEQAVSLALRERKRVIPILVGDVDLPLHLNDMAYLRLKDSVLNIEANLLQVLR
jgi:hypothetical protein